MSIDYAIITVLEEEWTAVKHYFCSDKQQCKEFKPSAHTYYETNLRCSDGSSKSLVFFLTLDKARAFAVNDTKDLINDLDPRVIFLVGVCAGLDPERQKRGDVVISKMIVDQAVQRHRTGAEPEIPINSYRPSANLLESLMNFRDTAWKDTLPTGIRRPDSLQIKPNVYRGQVICDDNVICNEEERGTLKSIWPGSIAYEMESSGVATAVYTTPSHPEYVMIKGIIDFATEETCKKKDIWKPYAAHAAASFTFSFLTKSTYNAPISIPDGKPMKKIKDESQSKCQVALSFAGEDRRYAESLAKLLKDRGISVFYDRYEQADLWGRDLYQHLQSVYRDQAQFCVVFLSKAYAQNLWTQHELKQAQAREFREHREYILPVRIDDTNIPGINETIGYLDLRRDSLETIANQVIKKLNKGKIGNKIIPQKTQSTSPFYGLLPPFLTDRMFGRDDKLERIKKNLEGGEHFLLYGEPGVGKTMLAAKICDEFKKPLLWYSTGTEVKSPSVVYGRILELLDDKEPPKENQRERMLKNLVRERKIKAIFLDNTDSEEIIKAFLSICNTINKPLMVTSHLDNVNGGFKHKDELKILGKRYANELFKEHLHEFELKQGDEEIIREICKILDYHPFDIKIVATQMRIYGKLSELKKDLLENEEAALQILKGNKKKNRSPYHSHWASLNLVYKNIRDENNQKIFLTVAAFPSKSASFSLISNTIPDFNRTYLEDPVHFNIIYLDRNNDRYEVHYLTQRFAFEKLKEEKKDTEMKGMIINSLKDYVKDNSDWDIFSQRENVTKERDNILGAMKWCDQLKDWENLIEFENIMRHYLYVFGEWDERLKWSQKVWDLRNNKELMKKRGCNITMAGIEGLCFVYLQRGENEKVIDDILRSARKLLPLNTENREWQRVWCYYHRVKGMLNFNTDFEKAKDKFEVAITFAQKSDWETMEIPIGIQLGAMYFKQKRYDKAITIWRNCINLAYEHKERKRKEAPPYRRIIRALIWLGKCYYKQGLIEKSQKKIEKAERLYDESRKQFKEAEKLYEDVNLKEPLLIFDLYFEWCVLEKESKNRKKAKELFGSISKDVDYYWDDEKQKRLNELKEQL